MRCIVIPVEGDIYEAEFTRTFHDPMALGVILGHANGLDNLDDCWIERVVTQQIHHLFAPDPGQRWPGVIMFVDEAGRWKELPRNPRASLLYDASGTGFIAGAAVLCGEDLVDSGEGYQEPETVALPDSVTLARVAEATR